MFVQLSSTYSNTKTGNAHRIILNDNPISSRDLPTVLYGIIGLTTADVGVRADFRLNVLMNCDICICCVLISKSPEPRRRYSGFPAKLNTNLVVHQQKARSLKFRI